MNIILQEQGYLDNELFSPEEMQSPFDAIKETDAEGREWWNSRKLARLMGYQKYWNFERLMDKVATFLQQEKGLDQKEHMMEIEEMAQLNNGGWRQVKSIKLSRTVCLAIVMNADKKKPIVNAARKLLFEQSYIIRPGYRSARQYAHLSFKYRQGECKRAL